MFFQEFLRDYLLLIKNPASLISGKTGPNSAHHPDKANQRFWYIFHALWLNVVIGSTLSTLTYLISKLLGFDSQQNSQVLEFIQQNSFFTIFLLTALIAPLSEEVSFRLMISTSKYLVSGGVVLMLLFIYSAVGLSIPFFVLTALIVPPAITVLFISEENAKNLLSRNIWLLVWGSNTIFALSHLNNFTNVLQHWYIAPVLVWTQFFSGSLYSLLRIKFGLESAMIVHGLFNAFVVVILYFIGPDFLF